MTTPLPGARWMNALDGALDRNRLGELTDDESLLRSLLEDVSDFYRRSEDWTTPYGPLFAGPRGSTRAPESLSADEIEALRTVAPSLPRDLGIRAYDVVAMRSEGKLRALAYEAMVKASIAGLDSVPMTPEVLDASDRALLVALRFRGIVGEQGKLLERALVERMLNPKEEYESVWISDVLLRHGLGREQAAEIAATFRSLSERAEGGAGGPYRESAAGWHRSAGLVDEAYDDDVWVVRNMCDEAETLLKDGRSDALLRAASDLESALKLLRTLPQAERSARGVDGLAARIAARITTANARAMGLLRAKSSPPIDLTEVRSAARELVAGVEATEAIYRFLRMVGIADADDMRSQGEDLLANNPLSRMFPVIHLSTDGRVADRSGVGSDDDVYGIPSAVWRQMVQSYLHRIALLVPALIIPAWLELTNTHTLRPADFRRLAKGSALVPTGRHRAVGQALYYGYNGDFFTAAQLLAPQLEHMVRVHLTNVGAQTRVFDEGIQREMGLSALMEKPESVEVFGPHVSFEIRALFCSPLGPNLRNEYAHGLVGDQGQQSASAIYAWWLLWKLIDWQFSSDAHNVGFVSSREPAPVVDDEAT